MAYLANVHYAEKALHFAQTQQEIDDLLADPNFAQFSDDYKIIKEAEKKEEQGFTVTLP
jgi:hypothetical protein